MAKEAGVFNVTFDIVDEDSIKKVVGLTLNVLESADDNVVEGKNEMTTLQTALTQTRSQILQLQEMLIDVGNAVTNSNTAISNINQTLIQANSVIVQANASINNMKQYYYMNDPSTGLNTLVTNVVSNLYRILMEGKCLTASAFDALARTASVFDGKQITAYDFDLNSRNLV